MERLWVICAPFFMCCKFVCTVTFAEIWHPPVTMTICPCGWRQVLTVSLWLGVGGCQGKVWDLNENSRAESLPDLQPSDPRARVEVLEQECVNSQKEKGHSFLSVQ